MLRKTEVQLNCFSEMFLMRGHHYGELTYLLGDEDLQYGGNCFLECLIVTLVTRTVHKVINFEPNLMECWNEDFLVGVECMSLLCLF